MRQLLIGAFALLSCAAYVSGKCCRPTQIEYTLPKGVAECDEEIKDGVRKEYVDNNGFVSEKLLPKLERRRNACWIEVCNDGLAHFGYHCGTGSCDFFGCSCYGGCHGNDGDDPYAKFMELHRHRVSGARVLPRTRPLD